MIEKGISEEELVAVGSIDTSTHPFVVSVRETLLYIDEKVAKRLEGQVDHPDRLKDAGLDLQAIERSLEWKGKHSGFGYLSASFKNSREDEILAAALAVKHFRNSNIDTEPLIFPVDTFYSYWPNIFSLVSKVTTFDSWVQARNLRRSIVLTDFADSSLFKDNVLESIPAQSELGLETYKESWDFGRKIDSNDVRYKIGDIFHEEKNIDGVLSRLSVMHNIESARLLLATILLLSDPQTWQTLWYESRETGTPLYIVGPAIYHHAMNRLNAFWGHGGYDYLYRAQSLNHTDDPLFQRDISMPDFSQGGLKRDQFKAIVEPLVNKLLS